MRLKWIHFFEKRYGKNYVYKVSEYNGYVFILNYRVDFIKDSFKYVTMFVVRDSRTHTDLSCINYYSTESEMLVSTHQKIEEYLRTKERSIFNNENTNR